MTKLLRLWHKTFSRRPRLKYELSFLILTLITITACLLPLRHAGWPQNHEGLAFVDRTAIYADHMRNGDLFPLWSSSDAFAMGTPLPLYYHKTFYYIASPLFVITGAMKFSIVAAIALFMLVGAYGMREATARFTDRRVLRFAAPLALLLAQYTFTDWLVRGAVAEFSAMMLVPWLLWWCITLVQDKRFSFWIVPIFFLLFNAHNITALYAMLPLGMAGLIFVVTERMAGIKKVWKPAAISAGLLLVLFMPQLFMQHAFLSDYNPGKITQAGFSASENFHNPAEYFYDNDYTWLKTWRTYTVQLDFAIWMPLALGSAALLAGLAYKRRRVLRWTHANLATPVFVLLATSAAVMFLFQCRFVKSVYEHVQILQYLQFPWRLLAFMTPLGILLIVYIASRFKRRLSVQGLSLLWLMALFVFSPLTHHFQYAFISQSFMDSINTPRSGGIGDGLTGIGEYLPRVTQHGHEMKSVDILHWYQDMYWHVRQTQVFSGDCKLTPLPHGSFDTVNVQFKATCSQQSTLALPISYSRFTEVRDVSDHNRQIATVRHNDDPRLVVTLPKGSDILIEVKLPTAPRVLAKLL